MLKFVRNLMILCLVIFIFASVCYAQEISSKDDKAPIYVVQKKLFVKSLRLELSPKFGGVLNDPFVNTLEWGGEMFFHFNEYLGVGGFYYRTITWDSTNTNVLETDPFNVSADRSEIQWMSLGEIHWTPIYNKASLMGWKVLHYDFYAAVGAGVVNATLHRTVPNDNAGPGDPEYLFTTADSNHVAFDFGLGMRFFITKWLVARADVRDLVYKDGVGGDGKSTFCHRIPVNIGLSVFFPFSSWDGDK